MPLSTKLATSGLAFILGVSHYIGGDITYGVGAVLLIAGAVLAVMDK